MLLGESNPSYYYYLYFISTNFIILTLLINSIFPCDILPRRDPHDLVSIL